MKIKICGLTQKADIDCINQLPVDYAGFVFCVSSPRNIELDQAEFLAQQLKYTKPVAVCVNQDASSMQQIVERAKINIVQLHGDKCRAEHHLLPDHIQRIYVITVDADGNIINHQADELFQLDPHRDMLLFDGVKAGSGQTIPTNNIEQFTNGMPYFIAGGVNIDNIDSILSSVQAYGVDVSSGVESSRGIKSAELIQSLVQHIVSGGY